MTEAVTSNLIGQSTCGTTTDTAHTPRALPARAEHGAVDVLDRLAVSAANGDRRSTEMLLQLVQPLVVRYCRAQLGRQEHSFDSADDVAQEICLAVFTALPLYRNQDQPFLVFMYGIFKHKIAEAHRAAAHDRFESKARMPEQSESEADPEQHVLRGETTARMTELLEVLPARQWEILMLRVVLGLSVRETAGAVGRTPRAVQMAQHKALARLRLTAYRWNLN